MKLFIVLVYSCALLFGAFILAPAIDYHIAKVATEACNKQNGQDKNP